ncbi:Nicotianamine synthase [Nymphaea thermarum]|nr:Nicotianamine synthase [Nymphaea thermarum]
MGFHEDSLVDAICEIYFDISSLESLKPSTDVNLLFTKLVLTCIPPCSIDIDKLSKGVQEIRAELIKLCGEAEGHLESHYSDILASYIEPLENLTIFPYYSNYLKLGLLEFQILCRHITSVPNSIAFVGSGPLPLTSIVLALNHFTTTEFHNYDINPEANLQASRLVSNHPDLSKRMFFHTADVLETDNCLRDYDVVFLAALVGMDKEEKMKVVSHLAKHMAPCSILMLRSAHGARAFLYPVVDPCELHGFEVLSVYHPTDEVINSVIIARRTHAAVVLNAEKAAGALGRRTILPCKCSEVEAFNPLMHNCMVEEVAVEERLS